MNITVQKDGQDIYSGDWHQAPEPVRRWIQSAETHHGAENLRAYLLTKGTPSALLMQGYSFVLHGAE